jgi:ribosomal protein S18 acetylase RimI-like enzyme
MSVAGATMPTVDEMNQAAVRRAEPADADELTRLRILMFDGMGHDVGALDDAWRRRNVDHFTSRLSQPEEFAAFVVDKQGGGLAACAVGWLNQHLIGATNPTARVGYIANICTDRDFRRRGYGRATLTALLDWLRTTDARVVNLHASADGDALYRALGFAEPKERSLTLRLD